MEDNASIDRIRTLTSDLNQAANMLSSNPEPNPQKKGEEPSKDANASDDVVDAEYTEK